MRLILLNGAALLALSACDDMSHPTAANAAPLADAATPANATPTDARGYIAMAGAGDQFEIQSSQLALTRSRNDAVRRFAQMMTSDHNQTTQQLAAAATAAGLTPPPPMLMPMQQDMLAQLQGLSGADFDRAYAGMQVQAHQMALALHQNYAVSGDTAQLRPVAKATAALVKQHLQMAQGLRA